jgi:hypothetical protein
METQDPELKAMGAIWSALSALEDDAARNRCINWALSRLGVSVPTGSTRVAMDVSHGVQTRPLSAAPVAIKHTESQHGADDWEDVFERSEDGAIRVIARDIKAKSRIDAAIRLVHLVVYANEVLNGQGKTSSKKFALPVLREWRAYDANVRGSLAKHQGIKRDGDLLSLDIHSKREAVKFIEQIRDESTKGSWSPTSSKSRKATKKKSEDADV